MRWRCFLVQSRRLVYPAGVSDARIEGGTASEQVWAQGEVVEVARLVEDEYAQSVVVWAVGQRDAGGLDGNREMEIENQARLGRLLRLAYVDGADAQDRALVQHPPQEAPRRVVKFALKYRRERREVLAGEYTFLVSIVGIAILLLSVNGPLACDEGDGTRMFAT